MEAKSAIEYVVEYCRSKLNGASIYRGLLKSSDHFASAFSFRTDEKLEHIFKSPNLNKYKEDGRKSILYPLSMVEYNDKRPHTLVVAPTGAGKTDFLMKRTNGRVFYTLPFQASINAMWKRFQEFDPDNQDIRLLHSTSKIIVGNSIDERILQPLVGSSIKVLTPHQLAAIIFGTSGYESVMLDVKGCDIILDEIHTYSDYSRSMVIEIVKALLRLDCRIHVGTATMPSSLYSELFQILGGKELVYEVNLNKNLLETFNRHKVKKIESKDLIFDLVEESINNNNKLLVIFNTVKKAQDIFKQIEGQFPEIPKMLIHSRFRRKDRAELENKLTQQFDGGLSNSGIGLRPCIVVSTQVVEVSLDISFDCMITEAAPLDGLIQRFGRVNRRRTIDSISADTRLYKTVYIIKPEDKTLPYEKSIVQKSYDELPDNFELLEEYTLQSKIDNVFNDFEIKPIDTHLIFRDGRYVLKELTDNNKSILIEVLEIEGAVCILESDRENYINANWDEKIQFEIPVNYKSIYYKRNKYEQLRVGSYPFVIPQSEDEHKKYGLELIEISNII